MTIKDSTYFLYNNESCEDYGVTNFSFSTNGMQEEPFSFKREIKETKTRNRTFFNGFEVNPIEFPITLWFDEEFDDEKLQKVARWLFQDYYKPLIFSDNLDKIYYAVFVGENKLHHIQKRGYVTLTVRCKDEYIYSPIFESEVYDLRTNMHDGTEIIFENRGNIDVYPEISISKYGDGNISIENLSDGGYKFQIDNLKDQENVYVNGQTKKVISDIPGVNHYSDVVDRKFLKVPWGVSRLLITGNCYIQFRYRFKFIA